jgi:pterin-4a-carbinolamine dehydratase
MRKLAFISYRRSDVPHIAQALYLQLKEVFGAGQLFMDVHSIRSGTPWPDRLRQKLQEVSVLLALVGPNWLFAADEYGRRRIDDPDDWVRNEILEAIRRGIDVIPIVIEGVTFPGAKALPKDEPLFAKFADLNFTTLHQEVGPWSQDVAAISNDLEERYGLVRDPEPAQPTADPVKARTPQLTDNELDAVLADLTAWDVWTESLLFEYPKDRLELRRTLVFENFTEAMQFMSSLIDVFNKAKHHPRWENAWNVVRIRLTTWDVGNKITHFDVDMARRVEAEYARFQSERGR